MRLEFDKSVPVYEQLLRVSDYKQPGRKHQHRKGTKAKEREKTRIKRSNLEKQRKLVSYNARVAAYWRGELDNYPK